MKMQGSGPKVIKNFQMVTAEHETKQGSFWAKELVWHHRSHACEPGPGPTYKTYLKSDTCLPCWVPGLSPPYALSVHLQHGSQNKWDDVAPLLNAFHWHFISPRERDKVLTMAKTVHILQFLPRLWFSSLLMLPQSHSTPNHPQTNQPCSFLCYFALTFSLPEISFARCAHYICFLSHFFRSHFTHSTNIYWASMCSWHHPRHRWLDSAFLWSLLEQNIFS